MYNGNKTRHAQGAGGRPPRGQGGRGEARGARGYAGAETGLPATGHRLTARAGRRRSASGSPRLPPRTAGAAAPAPPGRRAPARPLCSSSHTPTGLSTDRTIGHHSPPRGAVLSSPGNQFPSSSRSGCYSYEGCSSAPRELPTALGWGTGEVGYK